jgi:hypothetical protein
MIISPALAQVVAWLGCIFLLLFWLTVGRRQLLGFLFTAAGIAAIVLCARSDQRPATMFGILLVVAILLALGLVGSGLIISRRQRVALPVAKRRQSRKGRAA